MCLYFFILSFYPFPPVTRISPPPTHPHLQDSSLSYPFTAYTTFWSKYVIARWKKNE